MVTGMTIEDLWERLATVVDPELDIDIVSLGMVEDVIEGSECVEVLLRRTFTGCAASSVIQADVEQAARAVGFPVRITLAAPWSTSHVTPEGRDRLSQLGIALDTGDNAILCPHCGSSDVELDSPIGSAPCRAAFSCGACQTPFDAMQSAKVRLARLGMRLKL